MINVRGLLVGLSIAVLTFVAIPAFAAGPSMPCKGPNGDGTGVGTCQLSEVGPFMQGVPLQCGNLGCCTVLDMVTVVNNVGNFILGIVGGLVLLFYIWGGFQMILGGANTSFVKNGKESIKKATVGLVIIFVAYVVMSTLVYSLKLIGTNSGAASLPAATNTAPITCTFS